MKNIFISSTFRDMQAERDMVQKKVLPALREEARKYGENVGVIDLRWGVDTSALETEEGAAKVLKVCLDEIDRSHPYMLIFLGERYGWIPEGRLIEKAVSGREDKYVTDDYAKSVTALEIEYGALSEQYGSLKHCVICFREPVAEGLDGAEKELYEEQTEEGRRKLEALKERIRQDLGEEDRLITYSCSWDKTLRQLVDFTSKGQSLETVLTDCFVEMFRDDWKEYENLSWQEREQLTFHALMEHKLRSFVGREALLEEYYACAVNGDYPLVLQGEVGSGKTSLMCKLAERLKNDGKNVFVFFSGMGSMSTNAESLVKQMVYYAETVLGIKEHFGEEEGEERTLSYTDWTEHLHGLCGRVEKQNKIYFCIDALDQLYPDEHVEKLDFIMDEKNVQVIASCTDLFELPAEVYVRRRVEQIPALSEEDAKVVVRGILSSYSRDAYDAIEKEILAKKSIGNPLYISLLIQRLIMMDQDDLRHAMTEEEIVALGTEIVRSMPEDLEEAVVSILDSAIDKVSDNEDSLREDVNYLAVSRSGLRMQDLQGISEREQMTFHVLDFTLLMKYLDSFFYLHEDDRIDFTHKVIRRGLLKTIEDKVQEYNEKTGAYVAALGAEDALRLQEGMYYARILNNASLAEELLLKAFEENDKELQKKIKEEALEDGGKFYCSLAKKTKEEKLLLYLQDRFIDLFDLSRKEIETGAGVLKTVLRKTIDAYSGTKNEEALQRLCSGWNRLGRLYELLGDRINAQKYYAYAKDNIEKLLAGEKTEYSYRVYMETYRNLGNLAKEKGDGEVFTEALELLKESLRYEKEYMELCTEPTAMYQVAESYILLGELSVLSGQDEEAVAQYKRAITLLTGSGTLQKEPETLRLLADSYRGMGTAFGASEEAKECYGKALELRSALYEQNRDLRSLLDLSGDYVELAKLKERLEQIEEAAEYRKRAMQCQEEIYRQNKNLQSMGALADSYAYFGGFVGVPEEEREEYRKKSGELYDELGDTYYYAGRGVEKDEAKAFACFLRSAEQGNAGAQNQVGYLYEVGRGVEKNLEEALKWYRKSAEQGNAIAQCNLGLAYENGRGTEKNDEEAAKWYRKSAEQGYARAQCNLGLAYENGRGTEKNDEEALKWYRKSAEQGYARAQCNLGYMYEVGHGVEQNDEEAVKWYRKSAEQGHARAQNNLGWMYDMGRGVEKNAEEAVKWYRKAADQGNERAQCNLGYMYETGCGVEKNDEEAVKWYRKSADQGYARAQYNMGESYYYGRGVEKSYKEALGWYEKAACRDYKSATYTLGWMYAHEQGVDRDYDKAMELYQRAAKQGHVDAQCEIGELFYYGRGVEKSYAKAMEYYQLAYVMGSAKAKRRMDEISSKADDDEESFDGQSADWEQGIIEKGTARELVNLADMYRDGKGRVQDDEKAAKLYRMAAEKGSDYAQWALGWMYEKGRGVEQSYELARQWYEKAAAQGNSGAERSLGELFEKGLGVEKNEAEAVRLYESATEKGDVFAQCYLGLMYVDGRGVKKSEAKAKELLEKSAEAGVDDVRLQFKLGELYDIGKEERRDGKKAAEWYQKAVEQNYAPAQCNMALMHLVGNDAGLSASMAFELYEKAATQGNPVAAFCMGLMYLIGQGTRKNAEEAVTCFRQAAEQGHANAQFILSLLYGTGRGVEANAEEAERWYQRAMAQGRNEKEFDTNMLFRDCVSARENLGLVVAWHEKMAYSGYVEARCNFAYMHETGRGVVANEAQAIQWYEQAATQGDTFAEQRLAELRRKDGFLGRLFGKRTKK